MNHSARHDAAVFAVVFFFVLGIGALVTGQGGLFWALPSVIPVFIVAAALDNR